MVYRKEYRIMSKKKKKAKASHKKEAAKWPYVIHATDKSPLYPTHTHGMTELGIPEFLMDPLSFGPNGTGNRINASYEYFNRPENKEKFEAVKNGETVKLRLCDLAPDKCGEDPYVYCFRRVYPEFEMVKQAYCVESPEDVDPRMSFIQIYVEGDDYVLTDAYYKGGIKW